LFTFLILPSFTSAAQEEEKETAKIPEPRHFVSEHSGQFNGERIDYTATAGETYLRDLFDEPTATIFTFSYVKKIFLLTSLGRSLSFGTVVQARHPRGYIWAATAQKEL